jgi:6-phosphogluconolactonase (cycloisomerase 2 family)
MQFAYVLTQEPSGAGQVDSFKIDESTGGLTATGTVETGAFPRPIALDPKGRFLYTVDVQTVTPHRIDPSTGVLTSTRTPDASLNSLASMVVHPSGLFAYVVGRTSLSPVFVIKRFFIDQNTGVLTSEQTAAQLVDLVQWEGRTNDLPSTLVADPSGRFLYLSHLGVNAFVGFEIDETTGNLTKVGTVDAGGGQRGVAVDPLGLFVYVSSLTVPGSLVPGVSMFSITQTGPLAGALTTVAPAVTAGSDPAALTVDPSARFLYVANRASNDLTIFRINQAGPQAGALTKISATQNPAPAGGIRPVSIAVVGGVP